MVEINATFGIAMRNFEAYPNLPDAAALIDYGVRMEALGYESLWVWDHILLGVDPPFPIIEALSLLTAAPARTRPPTPGPGHRTPGPDPQNPGPGRQNPGWFWAHFWNWTAAFGRPFGTGQLLLGALLELDSCF